VLDPAWVALSLADYVGGKKLRALLTHFGSTRAILDADADALRKVPGIGPKIAQIITSIPLSEIEIAIPRWQEEGVILCTLDDPTYPRRLKQVDDAPPTLFVRGNWRGLTGRAFAVVGTREPTPDAVLVAQRLGAELADRGISVVSGLALGIDHAAHMGALAAAGYTLAVLGSGVLNIYPQSNQRLAEAIMSRGALLSEVHPNAQPNPSSLVARNRLISGLCEGLIVVQTGVDGGAMHAARRAWEQGRTVYAIDNGADGNRALIDAGATPIDSDLRGLEI
jgi:DNA processing protein